ncbi:Putative niacin/nicotinamide transporter NaiP [Aquisphaera giovannonii]|uniref:Niacin/nicotinamide transporter NaiP n=1 Tax=Aquisphaera giovannonii TaxID=406548 RepID=A0A5B9WBJ4_9BACT|nr:MFS transporter [Aquisphaera giovannonii]QEH37976.1 Putative niacin/nicotinamide transporter NaiP [Aquisphaera giovannonii]
MHFDDSLPARPATDVRPGLDDAPWWRGVTSYQWFVFVVASLGWLFDTMDQQLFNLARKPAVTKLLDATPGDPATALRVDEFGGYATSIFMIGWALGGIVFGVLGDRIGRARTMMLTVLCYSAFTGLSALSRGFWDFAFYRFLTGLGVGGQFAVGIALVAEVMPDRARPYALGSLQALSALGNMLAATCGIVLGRMEEAGTIGSAWRAMFLIGLAPALLAIPIFLRLKEPERWKAAAREEEADASLAGGPRPAHKLGSMSEMFGDPRWRRNTIVGMVLAFAGVVGLWGIGFFSFDLIRTVFRKHFEAQGLPAQQIAGKLTLWTGIASLVQNAGSFLGIYAFTYVTARIGRRPAFAISFLLAAAATSATFWLLDDLWQVFVLVPIMGFCQLALFGGYAIYFPELYPTRLRSTGTSFCYNVGRLVAAAGPLTLGLLTSRVFAGYVEPMRYAGIAMCSVFFLGLLALPFAPETRGQPLPE